MTTLFSRPRLPDSALEAQPAPPVRPAPPITSHSPSVILLVVLATAGILAYGAFLLNPSSRGDWLPYAMVITAETVLIVQAILSMWTILAGSQDPRDFAFHEAKGMLFGGAKSGPLHLRGRPASVDVFITTYGEDVATIRRTVRAALAMRGDHLTWVLDDGRSDEVRALAYLMAHQ